MQLRKDMYVGSVPCLRVDRTPARKHPGVARLTFHHASQNRESFPFHKAANEQDHRSFCRQIERTAKVNFSFPCFERPKNRCIDTIKNYLWRPSKAQPIEIIFCGFAYEYNLLRSS